MTLRKYNTKSAKLSDLQAKEMYDRLKSGELTQNEACRLYGLGIVQVGRIARGESRAQATGAHEQPVPNFNMQTKPVDVEASLARLKGLMERAPPSLYDSPPPTEDEDQAAAERALNRLNDELKPSPRQQQIQDGLDGLIKGD